MTAFIILDCHLLVKVLFASDCIGEEVQKQLSNLANGEVIAVYRRQGEVLSLFSLDLIFPAILLQASVEMLVTQVLSLQDVQNTFD